LAHFEPSAQQAPPHDTGWVLNASCLQQMPSLEQTCPSAQQTPWQISRFGGQQTPSLQTFPAGQQWFPQQVSPGEQQLPLHTITFSAQQMFAVPLHC